jgi:GT2 family glycosyltransferase
VEAEISTKNSLSVSVVILTQGNRNHDLAEILRGLSSQSVKPTSITITVNSAEVPLGKLPKKVMVKVTGENLGIPAGRNFALRDAEPTDLILFIDDDAFLQGDDFIERAVEIFSANPKLGLVQPKVITRDSAPGDLGPSYWIPRADKTPTMESFPAFAVWEGTTVMRWQAFVDVNGWSEPIFYAHEGIELAWRVWNVGFEARYEPRLVVSHPPVGPERHDKSIWFGMRNKVVIARRNLPVYLLWLYPLTWLALDFFKIILGRIPHPSGRFAIGTQLRELFKGYFAGLVMNLNNPGWVFNPSTLGRKLTWKTIWFMTKQGRPPIF